jgi:MoaA/NifB/PqqE/SkfB family radical SAM enzyme
MFNLSDSIKFFYRQLNRIKILFLKYPTSQGAWSLSEKQIKDFNKERYHGPKKLVCYNPFVNLYFNSRGQAVVCCRNQDTVLGNYPEQKIKEIWFGQNASDLREKLSSNDLSMGCQYCYHQIGTSRYHGLPSMHADRYATTKTAYPKILELELSNKCNLQCIMCSGIVSSSIRKCRENLPELESKYDEQFVEQLKEFLPHAREIKFYGGEPFLIDLYYKIWDELLRIKSKAKLHVVTNGTVLNDKVRNYLKNLNFTITVSFDSMDKETFESIRVGADFDKVKANILEYNNLLGGRGLSLSLTPMQINCREVPVVIDFCNSLNATINLSFLENPRKFAIWIMSSYELKELENFYRSYEFKPASSVNSKYNFEVYSQFVSQISKYHQINKSLEEKYFQNLPDEISSREFVGDFFERMLRKNVIYENQKNIIKNLIEEISSKLDMHEKRVYWGNIYNYLFSRGEEDLKNLTKNGFDENKVKSVLLSLTKMKDVYPKSYKDFNI